MAKRSIFNSVKPQRLPRNKFSLDHDVKFTAKMGRLIPVLCQDMVPGDYFRISSDMLVRTMPMSSPVYGNLRAYVHYFFVPNRLIWSPWEDFITGGEDGMDVHTPPYLTYSRLLAEFRAKSGADTQLGKGMLSDYLGIPLGDKNTVNSTPISILPFLAYRLIWNEYYRDQNVDPEYDLSKFMDFEGDMYGHFTSDEIFRLFGPLDQRRYLKDYFTSALPTPQRGPDVTLPMVQDINILSDGPLRLTGTPGGSGQLPRVGDVIGVMGSGTATNQLGVFPGVGQTGEVSDDPKLSNLTYTSGLKTDITQTTAVTINDLRRAIALQQFYEISARSGSRYIEQILGHFGVRSSDARLQRPEYLGGGVCPIQVGEVLQTSATDSTSPQGNMAGRGIGFGRSNRCKFFAEEHGYLMGIMSIVPEAIYYQGINKSFSKLSRYDYYWPKFANLGEQPIEKQELVATGNTDNFGQLFGYTPRYAEYKYAPNRLAGELRASMSNWSFARELTQANLNSSFLAVPNISNPFAVQDTSTDKYVIWIRNYVSALRPMPFFGTPSII